MQKERGESEKEKNTRTKAGGGTMDNGWRRKEIREVVAAWATVS